MGREEVHGFSIDQEGVLWYNGRLCVPNIDELKQLILKEAHDTPYSIHPGGMKMYQDLKEQFWWHGMKREIAFYIARCDVCQRVKAEHRRPAGLLQPCGNGRKSVWILLLAYPNLTGATIPFWSLLTVSPRLLTLFLFEPPMEADT
jgi:hypothetical protein